MGILMVEKAATGSKQRWSNLPILLPAEYNQDGEQFVAGWPSSVDYELVKRVLDIAMGSFLFILSLPILVVAGVAIKLTSKGPVIFKQRRAGLCGRPFTMYKLRTMVRDLEDESLIFWKEGWNGPVFKMKNDPRITRVGRFLRRTSIDELPQLLNVILGNMTLVGPRPLPLNQVRLTNLEERARLSVKPGITGLWQVSGRADVPYDEWLAMDFYYVQHRDLWLDLLILFKTIPAVLSCKGAY
jgi:lipopolysaccharide/colanic/teichoic acid biosynthesis glycosyltransferase